VKRSLEKQVSAALTDVVQVYQKDQDSIFEEPNPDALVGLFGPVLLYSLRTGNIMYCIKAPTFIIAMVVCLILDWNEACHFVDIGLGMHLRTFFVVKCAMDTLFWFYAVSIECKYHTWRTETDEQQQRAEEDKKRWDTLHRHSGNGAEGDAETLPEGLGDLSAWHAALAQKKIESKAGMIALSTYDDITQSCMYKLYSYSAPIEFAWDSYGYYMAVEGYCEGCDAELLSYFLFVLAWLWIFTLSYRVVMLLLWLLGKFLHSATFATWVADYCHDLDQENGGLPLATWIFENLVMRDGRKTQAEAMQAKIERAQSKKDSLERQMAAVGRELEVLGDSLAAAEEADQEAKKQEEAKKAQDEEAAKLQEEDSESETQAETTPLIDTEAGPGGETKSPKKSPGSKSPGTKYGS